MKKISIDKILAEWLKSKKGKSIAYHNLEEAKVYGHLFFGVLHNQGSYDRAFRKLKEQPTLLTEYGIKLIEDTDHKSKEIYWRIVSAI